MPTDPKDLEPDASSSDPVLRQPLSELSAGAQLLWITPDAEKIITRIARVSNPENQDAPPDKLIRYLIKHQHWSPFEMASACMSIKTSRAIARQILRHRFSFQEFSQRYSEPGRARIELGYRIDHEKNRQSSVETDDPAAAREWAHIQATLYDHAWDAYDAARARGVARELARSLLPEGLTPTHMYMAGTIRSWLHYCQLRVKQDTQAEHRAIAEACWRILARELPITTLALASISEAL